MLTLKAATTGVGCNSFDAKPTQFQQHSGAVTGGGVSWPSTTGGHFSWNREGLGMWYPDDKGLLAFQWVLSPTPFTRHSSAPSPAIPCLILRRQCGSSTLECVGRRPALALLPNLRFAFHRSGHSPQATKTRQRHSE